MPSGIREARTACFNLIGLWSTWQTYGCLAFIDLSRRPPSANLPTNTAKESKNACKIFFLFSLNLMAFLWSTVGWCWPRGLERWTYSKAARVRNRSHTSPPPYYISVYFSPHKSILSIIATGVFRKINKAYYYYSVLESLFTNLRNFQDFLANISFVEL